MKQLTIGIVLNLLALAVVAQSPYVFNYQGLARDGQGMALVNQEISVLISIVSGFEEGPIEFQEEHVVTTSDQGIFNLAIGDGDFLFGNLQNIDWSNDRFFIRTEIDPAAGESYIDLGTAQLFSVPFALYALESGSGGGVGSQELFFDGENLSISNGNTVDLSALGEDDDSNPLNELQTLELNNDVLSISDGNMVSLSGLTGDLDSTNELQTLSIADNMLSISNGNSVVLDLGTTGAIWEEDNQGIYYRGNPAFIQTNGGSNTVRLAPGNNGAGIIDVYGQDENKKVELLTSTGDAGVIRLRGPNQQLNFILSARSDDGNKGSMAIYDESGANKVSLYVSTSGRGGIETYGSNGSRNINLTALGDNVNHGFISVNDDNGDTQAGVYVDANGNGRVFADFVDSFVDNPSHTRSDNKIMYSMIQGPEAAAYLRGTARLEKGKTEIKFPAHFSNLIESKGITVMITPLSAQSKGIAVVQKTTLGFVAQELQEGDGNYEFDWEVKGVRKHNAYRNHRDLQIKDIIGKDHE